MHWRRLMKNGSAESVRVKQDGIKAHPSWTRWQSIKQRCYNPNAVNYADYGGRGIAMHEPWVNDSRAFLQWLDDNLGPCPEGLTLDRIDNHRGYEPGNLRWATWREQLANRRAFDAAKLGRAVSARRT